MRYAGSGTSKHLQQLDLCSDHIAATGLCGDCFFHLCVTGIFLFLASTGACLVALSIQVDRHLKYEAALAGLTLSMVSCMSTVVGFVYVKYRFCKKRLRKKSRHEDQLPCRELPAEETRTASFVSAVIPNLTLEEVPSQIVVQHEIQTHLKNAFSISTDEGGSHESTLLISDTDMVTQIMQQESPSTTTPANYSDVFELATGLYGGNRLPFSDSNADCDEVSRGAILPKRISSLQNSPRHYSIRAQIFQPLPPAKEKGPRKVSSCITPGYLDKLLESLSSQAPLHPISRRASLPSFSPSHIRTMSDFPPRPLSSAADFASPTHPFFANPSFASVRDSMAVNLGSVAIDKDEDTQEETERFARNTLLPSFDVKPVRPLRLAACPQPLSQIGQPNIDEGSSRLAIQRAKRAAALEGRPIFLGASDLATAMLGIERSDFQGPGRRLSIQVACQQHQQRLTHLPPTKAMMPPTLNSPTPSKMIKVEHLLNLAGKSASDEASEEERVEHMKSIGEQHEPFC